MIKRCTAYKLYCDACGRRIGGVFADKASATLYALCDYHACEELPGEAFCSPACREKLEKGHKEKIKKYVLP